VRDRRSLCMDEPFSALWPALRAEMLALVSEMRVTAGRTLLMSRMTRGCAALLRIRRCLWRMVSPRAPGADEACSLIAQDALRGLSRDIKKNGAERRVFMC